LRFFEIFLIAISLSMDAFAVSVCKGLSVGKVKLRHMLIAGVYFGGFQALMPLIGYFLGTQFRSLIERCDHWIVFALLSVIGIHMIRESKEANDSLNNSFSFAAMLPLALATSIDALAVGVTFAFLNVSIFSAVSLIGVTTFILSVVGVKVGNVFGLKYKSKAEFAGGFVLILMGVKILLEHLGILA